MSRGPQQKFWCFTSYKDDIKTEPSPGIQFFICQRERCPTTGREHWQGYIQFKKRAYRTGVQKAIGDDKSHCEVSKGQPEEAKAYCEKAESAVSPARRYCYGELLPGPPNGGHKGGGCTVRDVCKRAWNASSRNEAFELLAQETPDLLFRSWFTVRGALDARFARPKPTGVYKPIWAWKLPTGISNWLQHEFTKSERAKTLILVGPTRLGKTNWARSLGSHMFWRGNVNYGGWDQHARYLVIDDIPWKYIPQKKSILTQMGDITLTDKYVKKLDVFNNKPAIVLTNVMPNFEDESGYWMDNTVIVQVTEKLYNEGQSAINF